MLGLPKILRAPIVSKSAGYIDPACGYFTPMGCYSAFSCCPYQGECLDSSYTPPPPEDEGCGWTLGIGLGGAGIGAGATIAIALIAPT